MNQQDKTLVDNILFGGVDVSQLPIPTTALAPAKKSTSWLVPVAIGGALLFVFMSLKK